MSILVDTFAAMVMVLTSIMLATSYALGWVEASSRASHPILVTITLCSAWTGLRLLLG